MNAGFETEHLNIADRFKVMDLAFTKESLKFPEHKTVFGFADGNWISAEWLKLNHSEPLDDLKITGHGEHFKVVKASLNKRFLDQLQTLASLGCSLWAKQHIADRAQCLYRVAKIIEENQKVFATIGCISTHKALSAVTSQDIPCLIESFYLNAGHVLELEHSSSFLPYGTICLLADKYSCPLLSMGLRISSAIAAGNVILIFAEPENCLYACLLADVCIKAGIPKNVVNVIVKNEDFDFLKDFHFQKLLYYGSRQTFAPQSVVDVLIPRRPIIVVYENCDLHAAAESVLQGFFEHHPQSGAGGCKVMVQSSVSGKFLNILKTAFSKIHVSNRWTDSDLLFAEHQAKELSKWINEAKNIGEVFELPSSKKPSDSHIQPVMISDVASNFKLAFEELGGPIIVVVAFRTVKESISMFNCDNSGSNVSIWTEMISVGLEVADKLKTGTVWINSYNLFDASVSLSAISGSGNCVVGGKEEFYSHLKLKTQRQVSHNPERWSLSEKKVYGDIKHSKKEYKHFINGEQRKSGSYLVSENFILNCGSASDVQLGASCANAAQLKWQNVSQNKKRNILISIAKNLEMRKEEFDLEFASCGLTKEECSREVTDSIKILNRFALQTDYHLGKTKDLSSSLKVLQKRCPLGVIGIDCPEENPLMSLICLVTPAIMSGNSVVCVVRHGRPEPILKMGEIFKFSGLPEGVINIVFGYDLPDTVLLINQINSIWADSQSLTPWIWNPSIRHLPIPDLSVGVDETQKSSLIMGATYLKNIFIPFGAIFSN